MKSELEKRQKEESEGAEAGAAEEAAAIAENGEVPQTVPTSVEVQS